MEAGKRKLTFKLPVPVCTLPQELGGDAARVRLSTGPSGTETAFAGKNLIAVRVKRFSLSTTRYAYLPASTCTSLCQH